MPRDNTYNFKEVGYSIVFNFLSKIIGFGTTLVVSWNIGTTLELDLYYLVTGLIGVISGIIIAQESYFILPKGLLIKSKVGLVSFMKYYNNVLLSYIGILSILAMVFFFFTSEIIELTSKYKTNEIKESEKILKILTIYLIFTPINNLLGNILNSLNYFRISTLVTLISSFLVILSLLFFSDLGTFSLYLGVSVSSVGAFAYNFWYLRLKGWKFIFSLKGVKFKYDTNFLYANLMAFLAYFKGLLNNYLISGMGRGMLTGFNFGYGLHNLPTFLILSQVKIPFSIKISELYHRKMFVELNDYISSIILLLIYITVPINLIIFMFSDQLVNLLYGHGKFDQKTLQSIADVFGNLSFTIPLSVFESFIFQIFISLNGLKIVSNYTFVNNLALLLFNYIGLKYFGLKGFAISMVILYFMMAIFLVLFVKKNFSFISLGRKFLHYLLLLTLSALLIFISFNIVRYFAISIPILNLFLNVVLFLSFYLTFIYTCNFENYIRPFFKSVILFGKRS